MNRSEYTLIFLLRLGGTLQLLALFAVFLPLNTMDSLHRMLELGALPRGPVVEYMARSLSALYAVHGGLMWGMSFDVERFRPLVIYLVCSHFAFGLILFGIDVMAGMPGYWVWSEGPPVVLISLLMLWLVLRPRH